MNKTLFDKQTHLTGKKPESGVKDKSKRFGLWFLEYLSYQPWKVGVSNADSTVRRFLPLGNLTAAVNQ
jgi:hypothetical protein